MKINWIRFNPQAGFPTLRLENRNGAIRRVPGGFVFDGRWVSDAAVAEAGYEGEWGDGDRVLAIQPNGKIESIHIKGPLAAEVAESIGLPPADWTDADKPISKSQMKRTEAQRRKK